jgi:hypothetical protein
MVGLTLQPTSTPRVYEVRFPNLTAEDVEMPVDLTLSLRPVGDDSARPLQRSRLYSSVDPATGAFGGMYAGRESRLKLGRGQVRAIRIDLNELRWSLGPSWTWTPRELWRMVEPGAYELSVSLECDRAPIWGYGRLPAALPAALLEK